MIYIFRNVNDFKSHKDLKHKLKSTTGHRDGKRVVAFMPGPGAGIGRSGPPTTRLRCSSQR